MASFAPDINLAEKAASNIERDITNMGTIELGSIEFVNQPRPKETTTGISSNSVYDTLAGSSENMRSFVDNNGRDTMDPSNCKHHCHFEIYPHGFPRLAAFQNSSSDLAIFRRFGTAHCRVLMHLQCEITSIIKELDKLDVSDSDEKGGMLYRLRRNEWYEGWDSAQKNLLEKLQTKLSKYVDDILLKDRGLRALGSPAPQHYQSLYNWILGCKPLDGGQYDFLFHRDDFVASTANPNSNYFDWLIEAILYRWHRPKQFQKFPSDKPPLYNASSGGVYMYSRSKAVLAAKLLATSVASAVLLIPVLLLYLTHMSDGATAGMVLIFVLTFGGLMSLCTGAKLEGVFVGTCTYCAVLITFLGNVQSRNSLAGRS